MTPLRQRLGIAGRRCFEQDLAWDVVIERYYRPLLIRREQPQYLQSSGNLGTCS